MQLFSSFFHSPWGPNLSAISPSEAVAELKAVSADLSVSSALCRASREAGDPEITRSVCQQPKRSIDLTVECTVSVRRGLQSGRFFDDAELDQPIDESRAQEVERLGERVGDVVRKVEN